MNNLDKIKARYQIHTLPPTEPGMSAMDIITLAPEDLPDLAYDLLSLITELNWLRADIKDRALVDHDLRRKLEAALDKERETYGLLMAAEVEHDEARARLYKFQRRAAADPDGNTWTGYDKPQTVSPGPTTAEMLAALGWIKGYDVACAEEGIMARIYQHHSGEYWVVTRPDGSPAIGGLRSFDAAVDAAYRCYGPGGTRAD